MFFIYNKNKANVDENILYFTTLHLHLKNVLLVAGVHRQSKKVVSIDGARIYLFIYYYSRSHPNFYCAKSGSLS